jgi:glycosyltransferase involved in cell wall biosynthesis
MTRRSVLILTGHVLCNNPRVTKEADALSEAGWQVEVAGGWLDSALVERDRALLADRSWTFTPVIDVSGDTPKTSRLKLRVRARIGRVIGSRCRMENRWQLGYATPELAAAARRSHADVVIAHSEQALWAAAQLPPGRCVGVDMEDWFSEDVPSDARRERPVALLRGLERTLLRRAGHSSCPSAAMSRALAIEYGCRPPSVVYNAFPWSDRKVLDGLAKDRIDRRRPSLYWVSQTLGPGRGLEDLVAALPHVTHEAEIHLRGQPAAGFERVFLGRAPDVWRPRIFVHDVTPNSEVLSRIAEHDIGFAGEIANCRSRNLTVTNKLLHYLLGGLAVVASDTAGQREVAERAPDAIRLYRAGDPISLAHALNELLTDSARLQGAKAASLRAAEQTFCWERQSSSLVALVEAAAAKSAA